MLGDVPRHPPLAGATEAAHAPGRVRGEAHARLLAVVAHVDARLQLLLHHVTHGRLGLASQSADVDGLATVLAYEQVAQGGRSGQAADVSGEDAVLAALHRIPPRQEIA